LAFWDAGLAQVRALWGRLTVVQRAVMAAATLALAAGFLSLAFWAGSPDYSVLYGRLAPDDVGQVVTALREGGVPYRLADEGRAVLVPADRIYELRLQFASRGIPQGGSVGFEIFDKTTFGMSDFAQKVNYTRALEGELTRTVRRLEGVEAARVHLVLPERRLFEEQAQTASASVVLQVARNRRLAPKQVQAVVYLVSSSVEGLAPERITVVDTGGNVLYQAASEESALLASNQIEFKRTYERDAERRVREMLERMLGAGSAVVQVSAVLDFDRVEETSEAYDPEAVAIRSESRISETSTGFSYGPAGVPAVTSNIGAPGAAKGAALAAPAAQAAPSSMSRENETVNYEISKRVTRVQRSQGAVRRLTVAVAVDGIYRTVEGRDEKEFVPRPPDELSRIQSLVEKAVGFDAGRGDQVEVTSIPFKPAETIEEAGLITPEAYLALAKYGTVLLLALVLIFAVLRPAIRWLGTGQRAPDVTEPVTVAELEKRMEAAAGKPAEFKLDGTTPEENVKRETLRKRILEIVNEEPETAAQLVRSWLAED
jgi:flagellar M-ring protein FliF